MIWGVAWYVAFGVFAGAVGVLGAGIALIGPLLRRRSAVRDSGVYSRAHVVVRADPCVRRFAGYVRGALEKGLRLSRVEIAEFPLGDDPDDRLRRWAQQCDVLVLICGPVHSDVLPGAGRSVTEAMWSAAFEVNPYKTLVYIADSRHVTGAQASFLRSVQRVCRWREFRWRWALTRDVVDDMRTWLKVKFEKGLERDSP